MSELFSQTAVNETEVRCQFDPDTMSTRLMLEGPAMWKDDQDIASVIAVLSPDQMRSIVTWWNKVDPGDRWTTSTRST